MKKGKRRKSCANIGKGAFGTAVLLFFLAPVLVLVLQAFAGRWAWPHLLPESWSLRAWIILGRQGPLALRSIFVSLGYSLTAAVLSLILCYSPAAALVRGNLARRGAVETLLMAPVMVPPVTFTLGIHHVFIGAGLADRWIGVVLVLTAFSYPYMLRALMAGFEAIGETYDTTAENLGAGAWRRIWEIELPLLLPAVIAGGSVVFLVAFSDYYLVYLVGGGAVAGYSGYLFPFLSSSDRPVAAALSLLFLATPLLLFAFVETAAGRWYRRRGMEAAHD